MAIPTTTELEALPDAELEELRLAVSHELIRREAVTRGPEQIDALIQRFVDQGGDKTKLKNPNSYVKGPKHAKA